MDKEIVWTPKAKDRFRDILTYLNSQWSPNVAENFRVIVDHRIKLLRIFPMMGKALDNKPPLRKIVLSKYSILIYRIKGNQIILLNIYDSRRDPISISE